MASKKNPMFFKNYMTMIQNSVGSEIFKNYFVRVENKEKDILENGRLSCAVVVSSVLILKDLIEGPPRGPHAIVKSLVKNMEDSGWYKIKKPRPGAVLVWEAKQIGPRVTDHIGFYLGKKWAVSNNYESGVPLSHHWTYGVKNGQPKRKIVAVFWHSKLG